MKVKLEQAKVEDEEILKAVSILAFKNDYEKFAYFKVSEIQPDPNNEFKVFEYKKVIDKVTK